MSGRPHHSEAILGTKQRRWSDLLPAVSAPTSTHPLAGPTGGGQAGTEPAAGQGWVPASRTPQPHLSPRHGGAGQLGDPPHEASLPSAPWWPP